MSSKRKSLGKKLRFEVFKRDSFTCQYCGKKAPDVILHVDHIEPVADGGTNEIVNLITACVDCNLGKGRRPLSDDATVSRQHAQLADLQEKREQLEMMVEWQKGLINLDRDSVDMLADFWTELQPGYDSYSLNDYGRGELRSLISRYPMDDIMTAMRNATQEKMKVTEDGATDHASVSDAFHFVPRLLRVMKEAKRTPFIRDVYYIRGILRRRFPAHVVDWEAKKLLIEAMRLGSAPELEKEWAASASSYWGWKCEMECHIAELHSDQDEGKS